MTMAIRPTGQNDPLLTHRDVVLLIEELIVLLLQNHFRLPRCRIGEIEIQMLVIAGESLDPDGPVIRPAKAWNVIVARLEPTITWQLHPYCLAAIRADYTHAHLGIWIARLGKTLLVYDRMHWNPIGDRILRHMALVHLQVSKLARIRRPEVVAPHVKLFLVYPIHLPIQRSRVIRGSSRGHRSARLAQMNHRQSMLFDERKKLAVRRELRIVPRRRVTRANIQPGAGLEVIDPQPPIGIEKQVRRVRSP